MEEKSLEKKQRVFYRRATKVGNSSGVVLPKSLLGASLRIVVINPPKNPKRDITLILENYLHDLIGIYITKFNEKSIQVLAVSNSENKHIEKRGYAIDIVPLNYLKKSMKEKKDIKEKIANAKTVLNPHLLADLKKSR